jgi:hypothetical protein
MSLPLAYSPVLLTYQTPKNLKRIEVIADDEAEIIEAVRRMSERYDFVVTRHVPSLPNTLTQALR